MDDSDYAERLASLADKIFKKTFKLSEIEAELLKKRKKCPFDFKLLMAREKQGEVEVHATDSARSAWLYFPWKYKGKTYCGLQYKGVGFLGRPIKYYPKHHVALGGLAVEQALSEYKNSEHAFRKGVDCQLPIACYKTPLKFGGYYCGVFVRSFKSPIRLATFQHFGYLSDYLKIRYGKAAKKNLEEYSSFIGERTGQNMKKLFEAGVIHTSLQQGNITSEGEVADFDAALSKNDQGVWLSADKEDRIKAIELNLYPMSRFFKDLCRKNHGLVKNRAQGQKIFEEFYAPSFAKGMVGKKTRFSGVGKLVLELTESF